MPTLGASRTKLREILTAQIGLEPEVVDGAGNASLTDLGVDSIGVIELEKAVFDEYGVDLPDETSAMTIGQIIDHIDATARSAS
ncbi:acyl carrier protein [Kitasatospora sp. NPDC001119]